MRWFYKKSRPAGNKKIPLLNFGNLVYKRMEGHGQGRAWSGKKRACDAEQSRESCKPKTDHYFQPISHRPEFLEVRAQTSRKSGGKENECIRANEKIIIMFRAALLHLVLTLTDAYGGSLFSGTTRSSFSCKRQERSTKLPTHSPMCRRNK